MYEYFLHSLQTLDPTVISYRDDDKNYSRARRPCPGSKQEETRFWFFFFFYSSKRQTIYKHNFDNATKHFASFVKKSSRFDEKFDENQNRDSDEKKETLTKLWSFLANVVHHLPVMTRRPLVADSLVSPVSLCLVRHWYVLYPSSGPTSRMWSSPDGSTRYFPSVQCVSSSRHGIEKAHRLFRVGVDSATGATF